jgi:hypothetical protein
MPYSASDCPIEVFEGLCFAAGWGRFMEWPSRARQHKGRHTEFSYDVEGLLKLPLGQVEMNSLESFFNNMLLPQVLGRSRRKRGV